MVVTAHDNVKPIFVVLFFAIIFFHGCLGTSNRIRPELMADYGLVAARFATNDDGAFFLSGDAKISGFWKQGAIEKRRMLMQLKPGNYILEGISSTGMGMSSSFMGAKVTHRTTTSFDFSAAFEVRAGHVTNLGVIFFYITDKAGQKGNVYYVDNSQDVRWFLKNQYPSISERTESKDILTASVSYLNPDLIDKLRYSLVKELPINQLRHDFAVSKLGTLYQFQKTPSGKIESVKVVDVNTYEHICRYTALNKRFAFLSPHENLGTQLNICESDRISKKTCPVGDINSTVILFGDKGVVTSDRTKSIFISFDNGDSWEKHEPILGKNQTENGNELVIFGGNSGFYAFIMGQPTLIYRPYQRNSSSNLLPSLPDTFQLKGLVETSDGIFTFPTGDTDERTNYDKIYFLPNGSDRWIERNCPLKNHRFNDIYEFNDQIAIRGGGQFWKSNDSGRTWQDATAMEIGVRGDSEREITYQLFSESMDCRPEYPIVPQYR